MSGRDTADAKPGRAGFAFEFWAPCYLLVVALAAWLGLSVRIWPLSPAVSALTGGMCWAWWGGMLFSGWGRVERRAVGWLVSACAVGAAGAVLWPREMLPNTVQVLLLLWAGTVYARILGGWSAAVSCVPVVAAAAAYTLMDVLGSEGGRWLMAFSGPLAPLSGGRALHVAAVMLYVVPAAAAAFVRGSRGRRLRAGKS